MRPGRNNNAYHGPNMVNQDIYEESSTQKHPLGERLVIGERVFRYTLNGAVALVAGEVVQSPVPAADHADMVIPTAVTAESGTIGVTNGVTTAIVVGDYDEGYIYVNDDAGEGQCFKIRKHTAAATSALCTVTLYDNLVTALTTSSTVSLDKNPFKLVVVHDSVPTAMIAGVPLIAITASYYCWVQTWGPAAVLTDGTLVIGNKATISDGVDGAVQAADTYVEAYVGDVMRVNATTENSLIYLKIHR